MTIIAKLNNKHYEVIRYSDTVLFSTDKHWLLLSSDIASSKKINLKWVNTDNVVFDWIKEFKL